MPVLIVTWRVRKSDSRGLDSAKLIWRGPAWRLPAGYRYPDELEVWEDDPGHWTWAPARDMPLTEYKAALQRANANFVRI